MTIAVGRNTLGGSKEGSRRRERESGLRSCAGRVPSRVALARAPLPCVCVCVWPVFVPCDTRASVRAPSLSFLRVRSVFSFRGVSRGRSHVLRVDSPKEN